MSSLFGRYCIVSCLLTLVLASQAPGQSELSFSPEEIRWMEQHPVIRITSAPDHAPLDFCSPRRQVAGASTSFIQLIAQRTGLTFVTVPSRSWYQNEVLLRNRQTDVLSLVHATRRLETVATFSKPFVDAETVLISRNDQPDLNMERLAGKQDSSWWKNFSR